jgi:hypothetical protein
MSNLAKLVINMLKDFVRSSVCVCKSTSTNTATMRTFEIVFHTYFTYKETALK